MKRTVSVNIKGLNFILEEDAYETLEQYLSRLSSSLRNTEGGKEIVDDIELRISELCNQHLKGAKEVIELQDIESIVATLGNPEDYVDEIEEPIQSVKEEKVLSEENYSKRLFRDVEQGKIAGVCAGLAAYFNVDVLFVRALFLLVFFFGAFSVPIYIILWVITPRAISSIDRLRMSGKKITVDAVKEEVESAATRFKAESTSFANRLRRDGELKDRVTEIARLVQTLVGVFFLGLGTFILISFLFVGAFEWQIFPFTYEYHHFSLQKFNHLLVEQESDYQWLNLIVTIVVLAIVLFFYVLGAKLIFRIRSRWSKILMSSLFSFAVIGVVICVILAIKSGREYATEGEIERNVGNVYAEQLEVLPILEKTSLAGFKVKSNSFSDLIYVKNGRIFGANIDFKYRNSADTLFHVYQVFSARAYTHPQAVEKAKHIQHKMDLTGNQLKLQTFFSYPKTDKLRLQDVTIIIEIPKGKTVNFPNERISMSEFQLEDDFDFEDEFMEGTLLKNGMFEKE